MSFIDNIKNDIEEASARYDLMNDKIMLFESVAYNDYIIKQKEAYLDAYKYGGDVEDYMTESEGDSFGSKVKATINKIIENLKEFLQKCKEKIIELFEKIRESSLVKKLEELFKINPKASNIKVEIEDDSKNRNLLQKLSDSVKKQIARIKSGRISENDKDELDDRDNKIGIIVAASTATAVVTLGAILLMLKKSSKESQNSFTFDPKEFKWADESIDDAEKRYRKYQTYASIENDLDEERRFQNYEPNPWSVTGKKGSTTPLHDSSVRIDKKGSHIDEHGIITHTLRQQTRLEELQAKMQVTHVSSLIEGAKAGISKIGNNNSKAAKSAQGKNEVPTPSVESAYEDSFDADNYFSELCNDIFGEDSSANDDFDTMYSELCNDIFF